MPWKDDAVWFAIGATLSGALSTWFSQLRNRRLNIMPKLGFFKDENLGNWYLLNFGNGSAQDVFFAELDSNGLTRHWIRLNPILVGSKVYFDKEQFKHCMTLVAKYSDITDKHYYCVCHGNRTEYFRRDPRPEMNKAVPLIEASLSPFIVRR